MLHAMAAPFRALDEKFDLANRIKDGWMDFSDGWDLNWDDEANLKARLHQRISRKEARAVFYQIDVDGNGVVSHDEISSRLSDYGMDSGGIEKLVLKIDTNLDGVISAKEFTLGYADYQRATGDTQGIFQAMCEHEEEVVDDLERQESEAIQNAADLAIALSEAQLANDAEKRVAIEGQIAEENAKAAECKQKVSSAEAVLVEDAARLRKAAWAEADRQVARDEVKALQEQIKVQQRLATKGSEAAAAEICPGPARAFERLSNPLAFSYVNRFCMAFLYGRAYS